MTAHVLQIDSLDDIPGAIARLQAAGAGHRVPLLQAVLHGRIAHAELHRATSAGYLKRWAALAPPLPALALIGDDDHATPAGPDTWPIAPRAFRWARFVLVHGGAGHPAHYERAIALAAIHRRVLMVECASDSIPAWLDAAERWGNGAHGLVMHPPPGRPHPSLTRKQLH